MHIPLPKNDTIDHLCGLIFLGYSLLGPSTYDNNSLPDRESPKQNSIQQIGTLNGTITGSNKIMSNKIRVATWNMYHGKRPEAKDTLAELIDTHHVLLLQEAPSPRDTRLYDPFSSLHSIYAPDLFYDASDLQTKTAGNIILSKLPLDNIEVLNLAKVSWEYLGPKQPIRRNAIHASVHANEQEIQLWNTHLEIYCRPHSRALQMKAILEKLTDEPTIIGMDANTLYRILHKQLEPLLKELEQKGLVDTLTNRPRMNFADYILSNRTASKNAVLDLPGSDHKPISSTIIF